MRTALLAVRQTPMILRAFFRQGNQVFWNYGFFLLALFFACTVLVTDDAISLRPVFTGAAITLCLIGGGVYGVSYGTWNYFRGSVVERFLRSPEGGSTIIAFLLSRFLVLFTAVLLQLGFVRVFYGIGEFGSTSALLVTTALSSACFVLLGLCMVTLSRDHFRSYMFCNVVSACLVGFGGMVPLRMMPQWVAPICRILPSGNTMLACQLVLAKGAGWAELWPYVAVLACWIAGLIVIAKLTFDWMILDRAR